MELYKIIEKDNINSKKSRKFFIEDHHEGYFDGDVKLMLICKIFRFEIRESIALIQSFDGYISSVDGAISFKSYEDAHKFYFKIHTRTTSLLGHGRVRYERF